MTIWKQWFARPNAHMNSLKKLYYQMSDMVPVEERVMVNDSANLRPQFIQFNRCKNILMDGLTIKNSPFWTIHPYLSENIIIRNLNIYAHGHNNDGVDPEMSKNILIENCIFDQGDDAIAIKSGRNQDGWRLKTPTENIIIRNCIVKNGHQLIAIGSELSGGIQNIFIDSCKVTEGAKLNHLLFIKTNERRGGFVKNIFMQNIQSGNINAGIIGVQTDVLYQWKNLVTTIKIKLTPISNIHLTDIESGNVQFVSRILGQEALPVTNISLKNVTTLNKLSQRNILENVLLFSDKSFSDQNGREVVN